MRTLDDTGALTFDGVEQWHAWMAEHHGSASDVWLRIAKKRSGAVTVTVTEALDVALCFGWIDGLRRSCDETYFLQRYSRRRPKSSWSQLNVGKVEALVAAGRMRPPGTAEVDAARADGRWDAAYVSQRNATVPPDLAAELDGNTAAKQRFQQLDRTARYAAILSLARARTPAGRAARLAGLMATLASQG